MVFTHIVSIFRWYFDDDVDTFFNDLDGRRRWSRYPFVSFAQFSDFCDKSEKDLRRAQDLIEDEEKQDIQDANRLRNYFGLFSTPVVSCIT